MSIQLSCPTDGIWPETQVNERVQLSCSLLGNFVGEMYRTCYQDGSTAVWSVVEEKHCHSYFQIGGIGVIIVLGIVLVISAARYELPELQQNGKQPDKVDSIRKYRGPLSAS